VWGFSMPQNIARGRRGGGDDDDEQRFGGWSAVLKEGGSLQWRVGAGKANLLALSGRADDNLVAWKGAESHL
jgi:hypothetical protein